MQNGSSQASQRLLRYPLAVSKCSVQASAYGKCVVDNSDNLKKDHCSKQFTEFKTCIQNALKTKK
jgi:hypothetical protein